MKTFKFQMEGVITVPDNISDEELSEDLAENLMIPDYGRVMSVYDATVIFVKQGHEYEDEDE